MPEVITIYTVGHSSHAVEHFIHLLQQHGIQTLVDVRSQPYSRWNPQFNRESLAAALQAADMTYVDLGRSLGGRPDQPDLYDPGSERPDYERQRQTPLYLEGLDELCRLAQQQATVMMCSEGDPDQCHRTLLIVPDLLHRAFDVQHILPDGRLQTAEIKPRQLKLF